MEKSKSIKPDFKFSTHILSGVTNKHYTLMARNQWRFNVRTKTGSTNYSIALCIERFSRLNSSLMYSCAVRINTGSSLYRGIYAQVFDTTNFTDTRGIMQLSEDAPTIELPHPLEGLWEVFK